ncbi:MAG: hypothetical protein ACK2UP_14925, partial [Candidatus Promineifilaceae bacterium]
MESVTNFLGLVKELIVGVLRLDPAVFEAILDSSVAGIVLDLIILFLAGLSDTIGHSAVFFANRVPRRRFLFALVVEALGFVTGVFIWAFSIWLLAGFLFNAQQNYANVVRTVSLGYAPLLFGFLILLPYLGNIIFVILRVWVLLAVLVAVSVDYNFGFWPAFTCSVLGWALITFLARLPIQRVDR